MLQSLAIGINHKTINKNFKKSKKMKKVTAKQLAKSLDFTCVFELHCYLVECYLNGNMSACKRLFSELKKTEQKAFIYWLTIEYNGTDVFFFYFNLL